MIGGFQKNTLVDFSGEVACVIFLNGCNLKCPFCYNVDLALGKSPKIDIKNIFDLLKERDGFYSGICISGGEPTIYGDSLIELLETFRIKFSNLKIKLDTNGTNPKVLSKILSKNLVDYVAMDIKSVPNLYSKACGIKVDFNDIKESLKALVKFGSFELRMTMVESLFPMDQIMELKEILKQSPATFLQKFKNNMQLIDGDYNKERTYTDQELKSIIDILKLETVYIRN